MSPEENYMEYTEKKMSPMRKVIARNMHQSLSELAQLTNHTSFDATALLALRKEFKNSEDPVISAITINDILLYALSRVLKQHPLLNAHLVENSIRCYESVNLGIAVDTKRGLIVPTLFGADKKSLKEISQEAKTLIEAGKTGNIDLAYLANGTFTVSNLGSMGVEMFTPIINPPQTAILGVCTSVNRMNAEGRVYPAMGLSLTYDHRAVDGAPAARFALELCDFLMNNMDEVRASAK